VPKRVYLKNIVSVDIFLIITQQILVNKKNVPLLVHLSTFFFTTSLFFYIYFLYDVMGTFWGHWKSTFSQIYFL